MGTATQNQAVLERLHRGPLTPLVALNELGVMRLGARIFDLRREGHLIVNNPLTLPNGKRVGCYYLIPFEEPTPEPVAPVTGQETIW